MVVKELTTEIDRVLSDLNKQDLRLSKKIEKETVCGAGNPERLIGYSMELQCIRASWRTLMAIKGKMGKAWDKE